MKDHRFSRVAASLSRARPFLWLLALFIAAAAISFTGSTSYDDGGLGTASFLVIFTIGAPYVFVGQLWHVVLGGRWPFLSAGLGLITAVAFYLLLDRITMAYSRSIRAHGNGRA